MSKHSNRSSRDRKERGRPRKRIGRALKAVGRLTVRAIRLPFDFVLLFLHALLINVWKMRWYRRKFKRNCQCFVSTDKRPFCSLSFWYGNPELVHLICGQIKAKEKGPTRHSRCLGAKGQTPHYPFRVSGVVVATLLLCVLGVVGAHKYGRRVYNKVRRETVAARDRKRIPELMAEAEALFDEQQYMEAFKKYRYVMDLDQSHVDAVVGAARSLENAKVRDGIQHAGVFYQRALELAPERAELHGRLALMAHLQGRHEEAETHAKKALEANPEAALPNAIMAIQLLAEGKAEEAKPLVAHARRSDPDLPLARYIDGILKSREAQTDEAIELLSSVKDEPRVGEGASLLLAEIYARQKKFEQAAEVLREAVDRNGSYRPRLQLIHLYLLTNQSQKAETQIGEFATRRQAERQAIEALAQLLLQFRRDDAALSLALKHLELHPESVVLHQTAATVYMRKNLPENAQSYAEECLLLDRKNRQAHIMLGRILYGRAMGRRDLPASDRTALLDRAASALQTALVLDENDPALHTLLCSVLTEAGRHEDAQDQSSRAIELFPDRAELYLQRSAIQGKMTQWKEALATVEQALKLDPDYAQAVLHKATCHYRLGDTKAARKGYAEVLQRFPKHPASMTAANNLAWLIADEGGDLTYARHLASSVARLSGGNPSHIHTWGWVLYRSGDPEKARTYLQRAAERQPEQPSFQYHYGIVLETLGEKEKAVEAYRKVLKISPDYPKASDVRERLRRLQG